MLFTKPLFCSIADKYIIHEWILVVAILGLTTSYGLLIVLPFSKSTQKSSMKEFHPNLA